MSWLAAVEMFDQTALKAALGSTAAPCREGPLSRVGEIA
jgi:hypothetical protein